MVPNICTLPTKPWVWKGFHNSSGKGFIGIESFKNISNINSISIFSSKIFNFLVLQKDVKIPSRLQRIRPATCRPLNFVEEVIDHHDATRQEQIPGFLQGILWLDQQLKQKESCDDCLLVYYIILSCITKTCGIACICPF